MSTSCMDPVPCRRERTFYATLFALAALFATNLARGAPEADLWPYWEKHDPASEQTVDHGPWAEFLDRYLVRSSDGINRVRYGAVTDADRDALAGYIGDLTDLTVTALNRDEQFAYWVNLYNALTVQVILDHYPVDSIRDIDITPGLFSSGPWGKKLITVEGNELTLDDIEHRILRPVWRDPRIHYVVNCAALGCPNLIARPYRAADLEACLERQARAYINHPRGARFDGGELVVSKIFDWYQADFGDSESGVIEHLIQYADGTLEERLKDADDIDDYEYDWALNDASD